MNRWKRLLMTGLTWLIASQGLANAIVMVEAETPRVYSVARSSFGICHEVLFAD